MPLAIDTNVLVRALVEDGSAQTALSLACVRDNEIFIPDTVLLETEWVLRSRLAVTGLILNQLFSQLLAMKNITFRDRHLVADAVEAHRNGLDFADALHLLSATHAKAFVTFDQLMIKQAAQMNLNLPVRLP